MLLTTNYAITRAINITVSKGSRRAAVYKYGISLNDDK